jgi:hypothetical protein
MKRVRGPVLIAYQKILRRYRGLLERLQRSAWTRAELCRVLHAHPHLPPLIEAVVWQKLRSTPSATNKPR